MNGWIETEEEFYSAFPHDEDGNVYIEEIDLGKYADLEPEPEIVAMIEAEEKRIAAA